MIRLSNFSFQFPDKELYDNVSFSIEEGVSCAFIGSSGAGKSTLAEIILDPYKFMYDGKLEFLQACNIGYVSQFYDADRTREISVFEYIAEDFITLQNEIAEVCKELETATEVEALLEKYQELLDRSDAIDGDNYETNIAKKLGLAELSHLRERDVSHISGGEFKLVQVIKQMLCTPHFIIMDEPDSFLDFDNLKALKNLINSHRGTMLTITHSRYLLNHCFNKILHLENCQIQEFNGRYIDYNFELLRGKIELQELAFADSEEIARNDELIDRLRFIATNYSDPANGRALNARVKVQERLEARRIENPFICIEKPNIKLHSDCEPEADFILNVEDFSLSYDELLLENVTFSLRKGEKVAIIGANGAGKTSLIRAIHANNDEKIQLSDEAKLVYLSQSQDDILAEDRTILDAFFDLGFQSNTEIIEYLQAYRFPAEKVHLHIGALSGGEKNILGLAKVARLESNILVLDEPTSHLDTYAQVALEEAMSRYNAAIIMISHDFYSIVNCMDHVLIIEDKTIRKMRMRKFRKMIYAQHFDKDYLENEQSKKAVELKIEQALDQNDFEKAKALMTDLAEIIEKM